MKSFESFLAPQLREYLRYRQNLGYKTRASRSHLLIFDRYLRQTHARWDTLKPFFFLEMRANLQMESRGVNRVLSAARAFFKFLLRREYVRENPLQDIPPLPENQVIPFVFSPAQTDHLLQAACQGIDQREKHFLPGLALYLAVLLLARCGMRISEPLKLMRHHYRPEDGTLYIEKTKFKKQRLIPAPKAVMQEIENYLALRGELTPHDSNPYLLAGRGQKPLSAHRVRFAFHRAVEDTALRQPRRVIGNMNFSHPTPHSLRHSFAVNTLLALKERGGSPQQALPVLAAYLGHSHYRYTSVYLRVTDALSRNQLVDFALWQKREE